MDNEFLYEIDLDSINFDSLYIGGSLCESLSAALSRYINERKFTCAKLSRITGIPYDTVRYYRNGRRIPSLEHIVAISVVLRLFSTDSEHLLKVGGYSLRLDIMSHRIYRVFLDICYDGNLTLEKCNDFLQKKGQKPLVKTANITAQKDS